MKFKILLCSAFIFLAVSCSSDDNTTPTSPTAATVSGIWKLKSQTMTGEADITVSDQKIVAPYTAISKKPNFQVNFDETPKKVSFTGNYILVFTASYLGQTLTEEQTVDASTNPIKADSYSISGNKINLIGSGESVEYTIKSQTAQV